MHQNFGFSGGHDQPGIRFRPFIRLLDNHGIGPLHVIPVEDRGLRVGEDEGPRAARPDPRPDETLQLLALGADRGLSDERAEVWELDRECSGVLGKLREQDPHA